MQDERKNHAVTVATVPDGSESSGRSGISDRARGQDSEQRACIVELTLHPLHGRSHHEV